MDITLTFSDDDANALTAALVLRPQYATVTEFLQWYAKGAVDAGRQDLTALAVAAFQKSGSFPKVIERPVDKPVPTFFERDSEGALTPIDFAAAKAAVDAVK